MSIATELTRLDENATSLETAKTAIASAIAAKGGTVASGDGFEDFATDIASIPSGGGIDTSVTAKQIKMLVLIDEQVCDCYVNYVQSVANDVDVDWGDGSPTESHFSTGTARYDCASLNHTYTDMGLKVITFTAHSGSVGTISSNGFLSFAGANGNTNGNQYPNYYFHCAVIGLYYGSETLDYGRSLSPATDGQFMRSLREIVNEPNNVSVCNTAVTQLIFSDGITNINQHNGNIGLRHIKIPSTVQTLVNYVFSSCKYLETVDFTAVSLVNGALPFTVGTNAFQNSTTYLNLLFATKEIADVAKITTNLTAYATQIHYVGEGA